MLNRGLYVPWLVCRALDSSYFDYMRGIYTSGADGHPVLIVEALKASGISGQTWPQLILMGGFTSVAFFLPAFFTCATREHRKLMLESVIGRLFRRKVETVA